VGCAHCSVSSRFDSPSISDFALFASILEWMCDRPALEVIGISGGEPFVERRGLTMAADRLAAAGKRLVVFTSGVWASERQPPAWIRDVLARCSCVYLSTDAFHDTTVDDERFARALATVADAGTWVVVQVVDHGGAAERAERLMHEVFGDAVAAHAELNRIVPLRNGRGLQVFEPRRHRVEGHAFGACPLARSPMVRYDGVVTACCNENVIMGHGPTRLRRRARSEAELAAAMAEFEADPLLRIVGDAGLGLLTMLPEYTRLAHEPFATNCELCWQVLQRDPAHDGDALVQALAALSRGHD
jgi:hypothetical protein